MSRIPTVWILWATLAGGSIVRGEDTVQLHASAPAARPQVVRGEIVDYTGQTLVIRQRNGNQQTIDSIRVKRIETTWPEAYQLGREALQRHDYPQATRQFHQANQVETRPWARRLILEQLVVAYESAGQVEQAGDVFLALVQSDPTTPAYAVAPLAWVPSESVGRGKATAWMAAHELPAASLLGASHLLATPARADARRVLQGLSRAADVPVARLAEAQLWRSEMVTASAGDVSRWQSRVDTMPQPLQSGPFFVLGQAWQRLDQTEVAQLAYLRVPILFPQRRELAARALVSAARLSQQLGHEDEAIRLLRETVAEYAGTSPQADAQSMLDVLGRPDG